MAWGKVQEWEGLTGASAKWGMRGGNLKCKIARAAPSAQPPSERVRVLVRFRRSSRVQPKGAHAVCPRLGAANPKREPLTWHSHPIPC